MKSVGRALFFLLFVSACEAPGAVDAGLDAVASDGGRPDGAADASRDASRADDASPVRDAGEANDTGTPEDASATSDASTPADSGVDDAAAADASGEDAGLAEDAGGTDAGGTDASTTDASATDAGTDAGRTDAGAANARPTIASVRLSPTSPYETSVLTCTAMGVFDPDGDAVTLEHAWRVGGVLIAPTTDTLDGTHFSKTDVVSCAITPRDAIGPGAAVMSGTVAIQDSRPTAPTVVITGGATTDEDLLCAASGSTDADGDLVTYEIAWTVNGATTSFVTASVPASATSAGEIWTCTVTPRAAGTTGTRSFTSIAIEATLVGYPTPLGDSEPWSSNALWAQYVRLDTPVELLRIGMIFAESRGIDVQFALYTAGAGMPGALVAQTAIVQDNLGTVTAPVVGGPVMLPAGDYFIAWRSELSGIHPVASSGPGGRIYGRFPVPFTDPLPSPFPSGAYVYGITMNVFLSVR